jgi:hypothetical protein
MRGASINYFFKKESPTARLAINWTREREEGCAERRRSGGGGILSLSLFLLGAQEIHLAEAHLLHHHPFSPTPPPPSGIVGVAKELEFLHGCSPLAAGKFVSQIKDQFCTAIKHMHL